MAEPLRAVHPDLGKDVILGVTGSIAAYKALEVASDLVKRGYGVQTVMTLEATKLVAPLSFRTITDRPVLVDVFQEDAAWRTMHIALADRAALLLVAPATANFLAKAAAGICDDAVSLAFVSVDCPVLFAPAMNQRMWSHKTVMRNVETLRAMGVRFVEPEAGELACGHVGERFLAAVPHRNCLIAFPEKAPALRKEVLPRLRAAAAAAGRYSLTCRLFRICEDGIEEFLEKVG